MAQLMGSTGQKEEGHRQVKNPPEKKLRKVQKKKQEPEGGGRQETSRTGTCTRYSQLREWNDKKRTMPEKGM